MKINIDINNHGIINNGNVVNTTICNQEINYILIEKELNILAKNCTNKKDKEYILKAIKVTKNKDKHKLLKLLKKLSKYTIKLIENLSLNVIIELLKNI